MTIPENPSIADLQVLVGEWNIELRFPTDAPGTVMGHASYEWLEDGAFLVMHTGNKRAGTPYSTCIVGRDDPSRPYTMLYFDNRGVSRVYMMSLEGRQWKQWRDNAGFSQRFFGELSDDGNTIHARWEKSSDGNEWTHDFDLIYTRVVK
jgi:hypothetical protein